MISCNGDKGEGDLEVLLLTFSGICYMIACGNQLLPLSARPVRGSFHRASRLVSIGRALHVDGSRMVCRGITFNYNNINIINFKLRGTQ